MLPILRFHLEFERGGGVMCLKAFILWAYMAHVALYL